MRTFNNLKKQDSLREMLKISAGMYESSGSQFFTTAIQSRRNAFDESRFVMTFLTILGVTEISYRFRLVLEGRTGKEMPESSKIRVLSKVFSKQFCFIRCKRQRLQAVVQRRYSRFTFVENTNSNSPKVPSAKFLGIYELFLFYQHTQIWQLQENPFATLLVCLNFTFDSEDLLCWYKRQK